MKHILSSLLVLLCFYKVQAQNIEIIDLNSPSSFYGYWEGAVDFISFSARQKMDIEIMGNNSDPGTVRVIIHHLQETGTKTDSIIVKPEPGRLLIPFSTASTKEQNKFCAGLLYLSLLDIDNINGYYESREKDCGATAYSGKRIKKAGTSVKANTPVNNTSSSPVAATTDYKYTTGIHTEWIATGSSSGFTWFAWPAAPAPLKEMAKKISSWLDPATDLHKQITDLLKEQKDLKLEIALTDLDSDGTLGLVVRYNIRRYPGQDERAVNTVELYENAGTYSSELISVSDWNVRPAPDGWRSADGRFYELAFYPGSRMRYKTPAAVPAIFKPVGTPVAKKPETANSGLQTGEYVYREVLPGEFGIITYSITIRKSGTDFSFFFKTINQTMCDVTLKGILKKAGANIYRYSEQSKGVKFGFTVTTGNNRFTVSNAACASGDEECDYCPAQAVYKLKP